MGFSDSWAAVRGCTAEAALERLGLRVGGDERSRRRIEMGELPGGWVLFVADDYDLAFKTWGPTLAPLGEVVCCGEDEHVMCSEARGYIGGVEVWRVFRDGELDPERRVEVVGEPPPPFAAIREELFAGQAKEVEAVDHIFDIPPRLAQAICGYRLGEDPPGEVLFVDVSLSRGARVGWLQRLFGG